MNIRISILAVMAVVALRAERFDNEVRNDFFAGFSGNKEAMSRALAKSEAAIAADPKHAEALVWHGGGLLFLSRDAFQSGDTQKGIDLFKRGRTEMDTAVALQPDSVGVRIPRGAVLMAVGRGMLARNPDLGKELLTVAVSDYEHVHQLQKSSLSQLGEHPLGELLFGIADTNSRLGNQARAAEFFDSILQALPNTVYAKRAAEWKETKSLPIGQAHCVGCHTPAVK
jgi:hypothetical protein